jgi:hypothetical protein
MGGVFEATVVLLDDYYRLMDQKSRGGFVRDLAVEVRERVEQLEYLVRRVQEAEGAMGFIQAATFEAMRARRILLDEDGLEWESDKYPTAQMTEPDFATLEAAMFEARLFTECFYYVAHRIRSILRSHAHPLPGLQSFEAKGVRDVRNILLEHAGQGVHDVTVPSFGFGGPDGPAVKAVRPTAQVGKHADSGLYVNAAEFRDALENALRRELATLGS